MHSTKTIEAHFVEMSFEKFDLSKEIPLKKILQRKHTEK